MLEFVVIFALVAGIAYSCCLYSTKRYLTNLSLTLRFAQYINSYLWIEMADNAQLTEKELRWLAKGFQALRSVLRLRILVALAEGEANVGTLAHELHVSQPLISWHLTQLRQGEFVCAHRVGREMRYSIESSAFREITNLIQRLALLEE